jgi:hypothetical protein
MDYTYCKTHPDKYLLNLNKLYKSNEQSVFLNVEKNMCIIAATMSYIFRRFSFERITISFGRKKIFHLSGKLYFIWVEIKYIKSGFC